MCRSAHKGFERLLQPTSPVQRRHLRERSSGLRVRGGRDSINFRGGQHQLIRLLPILAILVLLLGLVSLAHAQEGGADTSSDPDQADDPPVALQQNSPVKLADNTDEVDDEDDGLVVGFVAGDPGATPSSAASYRSYAVSFTTGSDAGWYQLVEVAYCHQGHRDSPRPAVHPPRPRRKSPCRGPVRHTLPGCKQGSPRSLPGVPGQHASESQPDLLGGVRGGFWGSASMRFRPHRTAMRTQTAGRSPTPRSSANSSPLPDARGKPLRSIRSRW